MTMWKKVLKEILIIIVIYCVGFIYGYYNDSKEWAWLISAILVVISVAIYHLSEYIYNKKT